MAALEAATHPARVCAPRNSLPSLTRWRVAGSSPAPWRNGNGRPWWW